MSNSGSGVATGAGRQEKVSTTSTRWLISLPDCLMPVPAISSRHAGLEASARRVLAFDQYPV